MSCDHCGLAIKTPGYAEVSWCRACVNQDWDVLVAAGAAVPDDCYVKKYEFPSFHWMPGASADIVKEIPKITQRCFPDTDEVVCSAPELETKTKPDFCKRKYYGIQCGCVACGAAWLAAHGHSHQSDHPLCKEDYYGIECDSCPRHATKDFDSEWKLI